MKKHIIIAATAALLCLGAGCSVNSKQSSSAADTASEAATASESAESTSAQESTDAAAAPEETADNAVSITLNGSSAELSSSEGAAVDGSTVTITAAGDYTISGTLDDGQIIVSAPKTDKVDIYLDNVSVNSSSTAPLRIESADTCTLHLVEGSVNTFTDSTSNALSACISAKDDLTIKGKGTLNVTGSTKHAIKSSNDVKVKNGVLNISAMNAAIYGEDSVQLTGGVITVSSCKDGLKASNTEEADKGFVSCEEAVVDIQNASGNGIEAVTGVTVTSGSIKIHSVKQAINCDVQSIADGTVEVY